MNNYTHIEIILDESGSMSFIKDDMEGGLKQFLKEQSKATGTATVTLTTFSNTSQVVFADKGIKTVKEIRINPHGSTALYDAIGNRLLACEKLLKAKEDKPSLVLFVIITDGQENSSHEFSAPQIQSILKDKEEKDGWCFVYLGANQDSFAAGQQFGMSKGSTLDYQPTPTGIATMYSNLSNSVLKARSMTALGQKLNSSQILVQPDASNNSLK